MTENILQELSTFFRNLFENIGTGILFFGGIIDIILAVLDILITALVIYYILQLLRDSRAWQVLKGILLIVILSQLFALLGLQTIGFIMSSTLSVLAIAFIVLFQPELRRALETVGRSSFNMISGMIGQEADQIKNTRYSMVDSIVRACAQLSSTHTGALIIIERETMLGELTEQDNSVILDSVVSPSMLQQIFYKGSPLHDGAVLIRNGRILAARCHVPLSDNYHLRKDYGTRHRAAIGVSEMGDAIAVVVSEERGSISVAVNGRLYTMDNPDALRTILHRRLKPVSESRAFTDILKKKGKNPERDPDETGERLPRKNRILLMISSLLIATLLWLYVLIMVNPVETKKYTVDLTVIGIEELTDAGLYANPSLASVVVTVRGRAKNLNKLDVSDIEAYLDLSDVDSAQSLSVTVIVDVNKISYFEIAEIYPSKVVTSISDVKE